MCATLFTDSVAGATLLIAAIGFSWAITQCALFSLVSPSEFDAWPSEAGRSNPDDAGSALAAGRNSILLADARTPVEDVEEGLCSSPSHLCQTPTETLGRLSVATPMTRILTSTTTRTRTTTPT
ncbi:hypothetical protein FPV67DRAFT_1508612 [Lyophyllum atratum]|nr:hypothetical protein FPV67DRAFT_1508612 [Lyophyllum atratum]